MAAEDAKKLADDTLGAGKKGVGLFISEVLHPKSWVRNLGLAGAIYLSGGIAASMAQGATFWGATGTSLSGGATATLDSVGALTEAAQSTDWSALGRSFSGAVSGGEQLATQGLEPIINNAGPVANAAPGVDLG